MNPVQEVIQYHERTKHHPYRYARSPGYLDWATQPNPFRRFHGAPCVPLLLSAPANTSSYDTLHVPGAITSKPLSHEAISEFLQYSLALSAWKEYRGSRWALRVNPSSGNLHPTEGYVVIGKLEGLAEVSGVFHYAPEEHVLERRCATRPETLQQLMAGFPPGTFLAGLSSVHWREAWKYGERAYRYCQHDIGHALAALAFAAALQGWRIHPLSGPSDQDVGALLGLDRTADFESAERERPGPAIAIMPIGDSTDSNLPVSLPSDAIESVRQGTWHGRANRLSSRHVQWDAIDVAETACVKLRSENVAAPLRINEFPDRLHARRREVPARRIIRQRRSAVAMDGHTSITADQFYLMMDRVLPRFDQPPWSALGPPAYVHLGLFVHLVEGLVPGLYFFLRSIGQLPKLRECMRSEFRWKKPTGCPHWLPLYHLMPGDVRAAAGQVSCGQDIAADGAFSLGMIADFEGPVQTNGAWTYRRLFWETGMIGQVLYLEAEAAGIRSTGIGCFFDDSVHEIFGFKDGKYQSLYHFTVGGPVEDARLTTLPPYPPDVGARGNGGSIGVG